MVPPPPISQDIAHALDPLANPLRAQGEAILTEAAQISNGTLDYCWLLGIALGLLFGVAVPALLTSNLELANAIVHASLFDRVASMLVIFIVSLRVILSRSMRVQSWVAVDNGHHVMLRHIAASSWAAVVALCNFLMAAFAGYLMGLLLGLPGLVSDMLGQLYDSVTVRHFLHLTARVLVEAAAVAWISFFDMILLSEHREDLSRSITRKLLMLISAVIAIEAIDAYLQVVVYSHGI